MAVGRKRKSDKHLPARVYHKHGQYYYVARDAELARLGKRWNSLGSDLAAALHKYAGIVQPACGDDLHAVWLRYEATALQENAPRTQLDKRQYWTRYLQRVFGHCTPDEIRPVHIRQYLDSVGGRAANLHISLLQHMYGRAIEWEMATTNPCSGVRRNPERARQVRISDDQMSAWIQHAPPVIKAYCVMQYATGLRKSDLLRLRLSDISDGRWHLVASKTGKPLSFPVSSPVKAAIRYARQHRTSADGVESISDQLISRADGKPYTANGFDKAWKAYRSTFSGEGFAPNDLRKKHAVDFQRSGGDASSNLQHSSRQVTDKHYLYEMSITPLDLPKILDNDG